MTKKERALLAVQTLEEVYPQATCALQYEKPYELLIAVRLSAQCTDARVNQITPKLFAAYPTLESLAAADIADLEEIVRPCGFFHMKAKSIKEMSAQLILNFGGVVPDNMEDLLSLSGVGRKTANLILGDVYGKPAIVADTHFIRITGRLGLTKSKDPVQVEKDLRPLIPRSALRTSATVWYGLAETPAVPENRSARDVPWRHSARHGANKRAVHRHWTGEVLRNAQRICLKMNCAL